MNHYVSLSLTNRKCSVHLHALYSPRTTLRTFTPRRDKLVICGKWLTFVLSVADVPQSVSLSQSLACHWLSYVFSS
jgi:hypothetical protein